MDCYSTSLDRRAEIKSKSESDCFCFPLKHKHGQSKNVVANIHSSVGGGYFPVQPFSRAPPTANGCGSSLRME